MPPNETNEAAKSSAETSKTVPEGYVAINNFNRNHDPEDLIRYRGNWVAWSRDGRKVLFASPDPYKLCAMIDAAGLKPEDCVIDGLDVPWS